MGQTPTIAGIQFPAPISVAFDLQAFLNNIKAHGLRFVHWRAMRNPIGMVDMDDTRRPDAEAPAAYNGMFYIKAGTVTALCLGNTKEVKSSEGGLVDASTAQFTPLCSYEDTKDQVFLAPFDRLYLEEESVLVSRHELVEANITGKDRPKFPAAKILDCIDAHGNYYKQGTDFELTSDGIIVWGDRQPGQNVSNGKGVIYSIRYVYRPYWYVARLLHEIRIIQQTNPVTGKRTTKQAPQSALVHREFVFENQAAGSGTRAAAESPADGQVVAS
jgi:hypothetical protein